MTIKSITIAIFLLLLVSAGLVSSQVTLFVVQPIGAVPDGITLVTAKTQNSKFIDSADAMCQRNTGGVSLLCRGMMISQHMDNNTIYARFPYSEWLYSVSTNGKTYTK